MQPIKLVPGKWLGKAIIVEPVLCVKHNCQLRNSPSETESVELNRTLNSPLRNAQDSTRDALRNDASAMVRGDEQHAEKSSLNCFAYVSYVVTHGAHLANEHHD
jgi:hypothetical protein